MNTECYDTGLIISHHFIDDNIWESFKLESNIMWFNGRFIGQLNLDGCTLFSYIIATGE